MSDTPRTDQLFEQFGPTLNPIVMAYYSLCCELERELGEARPAPITELGSPDKWLVWSNEHGAWWGPNESGYFTDVRAAGRYTREKAQECCGSRSHRDRLPPEVMITEREAMAGKNPNSTT